MYWNYTEKKIDSKFIKIKKKQKIISINLNSTYN